MNFQESTTILNACTKKSLETYWIHHVYIYIYTHTHTHTHIYIYTQLLVIQKSKFSDLSWGWPEGSFFNSFYTEVLGRAQFLSLDCSTLPLIRTLYCWVLSKEVSSTIFKVFGMTRPGIEPRSPGPLGQWAGNHSQLKTLDWIIHEQIIKTTRFQWFLNNHK